MTSTRAAFLAASLVTALILQMTVFSRVTLFGARADLVLVVLTCFALIDGPAFGLLGGFGIGLLSDLVSDHAIGLLALVLCVVGYTAGLVRSYLDRLATFTPMLFVGAATAGAGLLYAGLSLLVGDERITADALARSMTLTALYDVALTPFVFSAVTALRRPSDLGDRPRL